jgi:hypothetical protein
MVYLSRMKHRGVTVVIGPIPLRAMRRRSVEFSK